MSHYNVRKASYKDVGCLVAALKDAGYGTVEVHDEPKNLIGYHGDVRPQKAHVIVRREHIGSASNDVGFVVGNDGHAIVSDYDLHYRFTQDKLDKVNQHYAKHVALKSFKGRGMETETLPDGRIRMRVRA